MAFGLEIEIEGDFCSGGTCVLWLLSILSVFVASEASWVSLDFIERLAGSHWILTDDCANLEHLVGAD